MSQFSFADTEFSSLPLLDEEFDKVEVLPALTEQGSPAAHLQLVEDLAWEDQLDNGEEIGLRPRVTAPTVLL